MKRRPTWPNSPSVVPPKLGHVPASQTVGVFPQPVAQPCRASRCRAGRQQPRHQRTDLVTGQHHVAQQQADQPGQGEARRRRPVIPPPAVPADTQPLGLALCRGGHRRDLPGLAAGVAGRPVDPGRRAPGGAQPQYLGRHSRDAPQPRPGPERRLLGPPRSLRAALHPHQSRSEPRKRHGRAGPLPAQGRHRPGPDPAGQPRFSHRRRLRPLRGEDGPEAQPPGTGKAGAGNGFPTAPAPSSHAGKRQLPGPGAQVEHHPALPQAQEPTGPTPCPPA